MDTNLIGALSARQIAALSTRDMAVSRTNPFLAPSTAQAASLTTAQLGALTTLGSLPLSVFQPSGMGRYQQQRLPPEFQPDCRTDILTGLGP